MRRSKKKENPQMSLPWWNDPVYVKYDVKTSDPCDKSIKGVYHPDCEVFTLDEVNLNFTNNEKVT